jgi:acetoin utilization protein AcuB
MLVNEVMTKKVHWVGVNAPMSEVIELMTQNGFHHVPIVDGGVVVGVISERDVLARMPSPAGSAPATAQGRFGDSAAEALMTRDPICVTENDRLADAIEIMLVNHLSIVIVVDGQRRLRGILSLVDIARVVLLWETPGDDAEQDLAGAR